MAQPTEKESQKILSPTLTQAKKVMLAQTIMTPGWKVVIVIANEACRVAMQDTIKLDPESEDYERVCVERQRRARNITEFSDLLMRSIHVHADAIRKVECKKRTRPWAACKRCTTSTESTQPILRNRESQRTQSHVRSASAQQNPGSRNPLRRGRP